MTAPTHAHDTGDTGRYYRHPDTGELLISVTNVADSVKDKPAMEALIGWGVKHTAAYFADHLPQAVAASMNPDSLDDFVKRAKQERNHVRDEAAALGTLVHAFAEAHILGTEVDLVAFARTQWADELRGADDPDVLEVLVDRAHQLAAEAPAFVDQYLKWLTEFGVDIREHVEASEMTVASPTHGYAGTLDLIVSLPLDPATNQWGPRRHLWLVDLKTSRTRPRTQTYPSHGLQLAAYRWAEEAWTPQGIVPMPQGITGTAILNLRRQGPRQDRGYGFINITTTPADHATFVNACHAVRWLHGWVDDGRLKDKTKRRARLVDPPNAKPANGRKARQPRQSRTRHVDPFALAANPSEIEVPF